MCIQSKWLRRKRRADQIMRVGAILSFLIFPGLVLFWSKQVLYLKEWRHQAFPKNAHLRWSSFKMLGRSQNLLAV